MKLLLALMFIPCWSVAQQSFTGTVSAKNRQRAIPFATVGLMKENIGLNADSTGKFHLQSSFKKRNDTLIISSVGYETLKIPVDQLPVNMQFELSEKQTMLNELVINSRHTVTTVTLNQASHCGSDYLTTSGYTAQVAQHFHCAAANALLSEVEVCKYGIAIIDPSKVIFRIRIYAMDSSTGGPAADLTDSIIEVKAEGRHVNVKLEQYHIYIQGNDFFVAVEWLKIPFNESKEKRKINGKKTSYSTYGPYVAMKQQDHKNPAPSAFPEVWEQTYTGRWHPWSIARKIMVAATVKY